MKAPVVGLPRDREKSRSGNRYGAALAIYILVVLTAANLGYTQYLARAFGYSRALGSPLVSHVYRPWAWMEWRAAHYVSHRSTFLLGFVVVGGGAILCLLVGVGIIGFLVRRTRALSTLHGSAHWAEEPEIYATGLLPRRGRFPWQRRPGVGVYVGAWTDKKEQVRYLRHNGPQHILTFAPTRSGKGVGLIIPTLLSWNESVVVLDLKGENWELSAGWRKQRGHVVLKFDPLDTDGNAACFNPLEEVRLGTPHEVADAQNIVNMIIDPDGKGMADHWDKTSFMFLVGVVLHAMYVAKKDGKTASLPMVADIISSREGIDKLYVAMTDNTFAPDGTVHRAIEKSAIDMMEKDERERSSVLSSAKTFFLLYSDPIVSRNISRSDFKIRDLMNTDRPVSLYIVVDPENKERLKPLIRLMLTQIVRTLTPRLKFSKGSAVSTYKHRLLLLLDEFPALGKLPIFQDALAHIAGYGLKAYIFVQDLTQLKSAYGEHESISSACHIRTAFAPNTLETAKKLSEMTGTTTVVKRVTSQSGKRFGVVLGQVSETLQETGRPLLTPDECMRLPGPRMDPHDDKKILEPGDMLVFVSGFSPIYGTQPLFFKDPTFRDRAAIPAPTMTDRLRAVPVAAEDSPASEADADDAVPEAT